MKIMQNTFAVFWSPSGSDMQFHADVPAKTAPEAYASYREMFPEDVVRSVRGLDGRFQAYPK